MTNNIIKSPPKGLAVLALVGPSFVWCAEYIGSGEVILATRAGAILGIGITWAIVLGIFLKYWIGMSGARYTVCTGEGMIDMLARMPGPKNWAVWIVLVAQFVSGAISIGALATAASVFVSNMINVPAFYCGWIITIFSLSVVWSGVFDILKYIMSLFVFIIVLGVMYVSLTVFPGIREFMQGMMFSIPDVPQWAIDNAGVNENPWREILPLIGWAAGGFASQVWYTYWVMGAGYGATQGRGYGKPADLEALGSMNRDSAEKIKSWCRVVYADATLAMIIGVVVTVGFLVAGAGVLRPNQLAPTDADVAVTLSNIFSSRWGEIGGFLFMLSGAVALIATQIGQLAGWPRLLADSFRICIPKFDRTFPWKTQFRIFLVFFLITNMLIVYTMGLKPIFMVKMGAILEGLLLTPLQALWVAIGLYVVLPRILSKEAYSVLKAHWIFGLALGIAFIVFGVFCIIQIPISLGLG